MKSIVRTITRAAEATDDSQGIEVIDLANLDATKLVRGQVSATTGRAAYEAIKRAVELTRTGETAAAHSVTGGLITPMVRAVQVLLPRPRSSATAENADAAAA